MIRRTITTAATALFCTALMVGSAHAFSRAEAICVKGARTRAKSDVSNFRRDRATQLNAEIQTCLNDTDGCVLTCVAGQGTCQKPAKDALDLCKSDPHVGCKQANAAAVAACGSDPDPIGCVDKAQLQLFLCLQACAAAAQPDFIECNGQFNDCLQGCSNPVP